MRHPLFSSARLLRLGMFAGTGAIAACSGGDGEADDPFVSHCEESGVICNYSGTPEVASFGGDDIPAIESGMYLPQDVTFHEDGTAFVIDWNNHRIRQIDAEGKIHTVSGTGFLGDGPEGDALAAAYNHPTNIIFNPADPNEMAIAAWHNSRIELLHLDTNEIEFIAGTGDRNYNGPGEAATRYLDLPSGVAYDATGENLYFMDQANQLIRVIKPDGTIDDICGHQRDPGYDGDGGPAKKAAIHASTGQAADPSNRIVMHEGKLYMVDSQNSVVRVIDENGIINTIAGLGAAGYIGDGGPATAAQFAIPRDLAIGPDGEIYIADTDNSCVRVINPDGIVETFAGQCGVEGWDGDNGPAVDAVINRPYGVAVDVDGNVFVSDTYNHVIRKITR